MSNQEQLPIFYNKTYVEKCIPNGPNANASSREGHGIYAITIHYTRGLSARGSLKWGQLKEAKGAAHFYIGRGGKVLQSVPLVLRAWHHGRSEVDYKGQKPLFGRTDYGSVGIEMANAGPLTERDGHWFLGNKPNAIKYSPHKYGYPLQGLLEFDNGREIGGIWEQYHPSALASLVKLTCDLVRDFHVPLQNILGHEDVARPLALRKTDPGPLFPWRWFLMSVSEELGVDYPEDVWSLHKTQIR